MNTNNSENKIYTPDKMCEIYTNEYENSICKNNNSLYYPSLGSTLEYNIDYISFLKQFIKDKNIGLINDLGCGTFLCGPSIYGDLQIIYNGYDIYEPIIELNKLNTTQYNTNFFVLDFYNQMDKIPFSDLIILKDVLSYWSNECINTFLKYIIETKKCKYILITNCCYQDINNLDVDLGKFRPLTAELSPLKDFDATLLLKYNTKEVSLISLV
jgi:hypothetical protein